MLPAVAQVSPAGNLIVHIDEREAIRTFAENEKAASTRRSYQSDMRMFTAWCEERHLCPLPAVAETVIRHISFAATQGLSPSSIGRRLAAIAYVHRLARLPSPCGAEEVKTILAGIRRTIGTAPKRKAAATHDLVARMLAECGEGMIGIRDRAVVSFGFAGAFRRSELVALEVRDLELTDDGYRVTIRRSKTDQAGQGQTIPIPRGYKLRPVAAVQAWLQAAQIAEGLVFRQVHRSGAVRPDGLSGAAVADIVKKLAIRAGLDAEQFSGHSLRAGFLTSAAEAGASIFKMREVSRHKSMDVLGDYVRNAKLFDDPAGGSFL